MAVAARYSYVTASSVSTVFKSEKDTKSATRPTLEATQSTPGEPNPQDPWAGKPRLNILLLGGDAGPGRTGTRTDTVILASIDTKTGDTTLFSLPRNTGRMPFPSHSPLHKYYPYGFTNGDGNDAEYFLNAMYHNVPRHVPKDVLGQTDNLGADALKLSVGEALGLPVDYYVLINLQGFSKMINALGGITAQHQHLHPDRRQHRSPHPAEGVPQAGAEPEAQRTQRALVRPRSLRLGRLRTDGPAALRDQRDHQAGQPGQHAGPLRGHRQGGQADRLHRHAAGGAAADGRPEPAGQGRQRPQHRLQARGRRLLSPDPDFSLMRKRVKAALGETKNAQGDEEEVWRNEHPRAKTSTTAARTTPRWRRQLGRTADHRPSLERA